MSVGPLARSPLLLVDDAVRQLSAPPISFLMDPIELGLPPRDQGVSVEQARRELARRDTSFEVKNQAWELLIARAQGGDPVWALAAVGVALPRLRRLAGELASGQPDCRADLDAEILTGFLTAVAGARTRAQRRFPALVRVTRRCGLAWLRERRDAPTALGDIEAHQLTAVAGGDREHAPPRTELVKIGGGAGPVGHPDVVLADAVAAGLLTESEAEIIAATRLERRPLREVAAAHGVSSNTLWMRRDRAEKRLITALAQAVAADDGDRASDPTHAHLLATIPLGNRLHPATPRRSHPRGTSAQRATAPTPQTTPSAPGSPTPGVAATGAAADIAADSEGSGHGRCGHARSADGQRVVHDTASAPARPQRGRPTIDRQSPGHPLAGGGDRAGHAMAAGRPVRAVHTPTAPRCTPNTVSTPGDHTGPQRGGAPRVASFIVFVGVLSSVMVPGTEHRGLHPVSVVRASVAVRAGSTALAPPGSPVIPPKSPSRLSRLHAAGSPPRSRIGTDEHSGRPLRRVVLAQAGPDGTAQLTRVLNNIRTWLMGLLITLATLLLTVGGVRYLCAGGDPGEVEAAKRAVKSAAIGYTLAALAPALVAILRNLVGT